MSETMPLNEWPVEKLCALQYMILSSEPLSTSTESETLKFYADRSHFNDIIISAIKDAAKKLTELPF